MALFIKFGEDDEVNFSDVDPKIVLPIMRKHDIYWGAFNPFRDMDIGAEVARAVALAHEKPIDLNGYKLTTMGGLSQFITDHWDYVEGDDLPKTSTATGSPSTDGPTTETSSGSSEPTDGNQTEPAA